MQKKVYLFLLVLFVLSRLFFINTSPVFFDSNEYLDLFAYDNFVHAIVSGHFPPHEGYIILFWPVFQLVQFFSVNPIFFIILGHIFLATITIIYFYKIIEYLTDKKTALISVILVSSIPLFWIINVTIMMESAYITFFFLSLFFLIQYKKIKKNHFFYIASFFFTLSFLTHPMIIIWLPLYLALAWDNNKKKFTFSFLSVGIFLTLGVVLNTLFISLVTHHNIETVFQNFYLSKSNEFSNVPLTFHGFLITMRNFFLPLLRNNTSLIVILGCISLVILLFKNKNLFILGFLWIAPAFYANQWWDSLLNGRHALIASFGFAFLTAYLLRKNILAVSLVILYLLFVSLPIMNLLNKPVPYLVQAEAVKTLPADSLLIETHFAKPQVEKTFRGKLLAVNDPLINKEVIKEEIDNYLQQSKPVFITSGALSEPYGLYSGPYLHNITLSYAKSFELEPVMTNYVLEVYQTVNAEDNLFIYKIISSEKTTYPAVKNLTDSFRRLDYYDPIARLLWLKI